MSEKKATVSCIIACRNASATLEAALESALSQANVEVEVVIVDDASTDDSVALITRLAERDTRIKLLQNQEKRGPAEARNAAIDVATGEWIAVLDADDEFVHARLTKMLSAAQACKGDAIFDNQRVLERHESGDQGYPAFVGFPEWIELSDFYRLSAFKKGRLSIGYAKPLVRRSMLLANGIRYEPSLHVSEDWRFLHDIILAGKGIKFAQEPTYRYYRSASSITRGSRGNPWWIVLRAYSSAATRGCGYTTARQKAILLMLLLGTGRQACLKEVRNLRGASKKGFKKMKGLVRPAQPSKNA